MASIKPGVKRSETPGSNGKKEMLARGCGRQSKAISSRINERGRFVLPPSPAARFTGSLLFVLPDHCLLPLLAAYCLLPSVLRFLQRQLRHMVARRDEEFILVIEDHAGRSPAGIEHSKVTAVSIKHLNTFEVANIDAALAVNRYS